MSPFSSDRSWSGQRAAISSLLLLSLVVWALALHHGIGPAPITGATAWWQPRGFLTRWLQVTSLGLWLESPRATVVAFSLPALLLLAAVFATSPSALARTMGLAAFLATLLFLFYGTGETRPAIWAFFGWRGSAVMLCTALVTAPALCAPWLARSWLALGWPLRIAVYLPVLATALWAQRDVTGTNPMLPLALSPWPVVSFFGIEVADALIAGGLACLALLLAGLGRLRSQPLVALLAVAVALATPAVWVWFRLGANLAILLAAFLLGAVAIAWSSKERMPQGALRPPRMRAAARSTAVGALLLALPILGGDLAVVHDYTVSRSQNAQQIIDALARYLQRQHSYPESLEELVAAGDLVEIPRPRVGFGSGTAAFTYTNFGSSYLLEFSAQRWMQCAYTPPWSDDSAGADDGPRTAAPAGADADEKSKSGSREETGDTADDEHTYGAWSCPTKPPDLW